MLALILLALLPPADAPIDYEGTLNSRLGKSVTPESNAVVGLLDALGPSPDRETRPDAYFTLLGVPRPPKEGKYFVKLLRHGRDTLKLDDPNVLYDELRAAGRRPWKPADLPRLAAWLTLNDAPLAAIAGAVRRPRYFNPHLVHVVNGKRGDLTGALLYGVQECRELAPVLTARAMLRLGESKPAEAWADLLTCHRLAAHVANGGTVIESLVGIAIDGVACEADAAYSHYAKLSAAELRARLKEFDALPPLPPAEWAIDLGERCSNLDAFQNIGRATAEEQQQAGAPPGAGIAAGDWRAAGEYLNTCYDRIADAARLPDGRQRLDAFKALGRQFGRPKRDAKNVPPATAAALRVADTLAGLIAPALERTLDANDRAEQIRQNTRIALALSAFRADKGRCPTKLDELAPNYLATVPGDLFSGKPLQYEVKAGGYSLYSVGPNGKDDAGRGRSDDPPGDDIGLNVPPKSSTAP